MKAIVIGSSTGGPEALVRVITKLPADLNAVVIVIQHLPIQFTKTMSTRLDEKSPIKVTQMLNGEYLESRHCYVVPGDFHFGLAGKELQTYLIRSTSTLSPSIDIGFISVAEHFGKNTLGVILTGMGEDGKKGSMLVKQLGGKVVAQNKDTSVVYGMPRAVVDSGLADEVLPLELIPNKIIEFVNGA